MFTKANWVRENAEKLCPILRKNIINTYRHSKWVPCFLHKILEALQHRFARHRVIIQFSPADTVATSNISDLSNLIRSKIKHKFPLINSVSTTVNIKTLQKMVNVPGVARIWHDQEVHALLDIATPATNSPAVWDMGNEGKGVGIAILDTGIYPHPDLTSPENRIVGFKDFVKGRAKPYDDNGHGTHCAGDAAGNGFKSDGAYKGPAPKAQLIGVKVLDKMGSGVISKIIAGIQWCVDNKEKYSIKIISMSLGASAKQSSADDPLCQALRKTWDYGIIICAAAGNEGPGSGTVGTPGIEPKIITVGAIDDKNTVAVSDDIIALFSSRGPTIDGYTKPDVVSPGVNIISLRAPKSYLDKTNPKFRVGQWYTALSGTSMATPVCAGVTALILENDLNLTPDKVKNLLMQTCRKIDPNPNNQGAGLIDAIAASASVGLSLQSLKTNPCLVKPL